PVRMGGAPCAAALPVGRLLVLVSGSRAPPGRAHRAPQPSLTPPSPAQVEEPPGRLAPGPCQHGHYSRLPPRMGDNFPLPPSGVGTPLAVQAGVTHGHSGPPRAAPTAPAAVRWRVLNCGGILALFGPEKMMHKLPTAWSQVVWRTSRHGHWLTCERQV